MSGKFLARASALSLAFFLAACGGDDSSSPLAGTDNNDQGAGSDNSSDQDSDTTLTLELGTGSEADFQAGRIQASATELSSGGSTRLEFNIVNASDGNSIYNAEPTEIAITSTCDSSVFDSNLTTSSGKVSTAYEAGCSGKDTVTARLEDGSSATVTLNIAAPEAGSLNFISVDPDSIALSGSSDSSRGSVSVVTFRLDDNSGRAVEGEKVTFTLSTTVGDISLSQSEAETNSNGEVITRVNSGSVPTVVSVAATVELDSGETLQTTSDPISVSASIPDQDSFSISVEENFLPNARNYDGIEVPITIRAADRNNNRVENAVVNFLTNGGSVQSECTIEEGSCNIEWQSQNPRPDNGVILVLARTVGEESFEDLNSDGKYDDSVDGFNSSTDDRGEAFLDKNGNGARDSDEPYFDYNSNDQYDGPNGIYNGTACLPDADCSTNLLEISETAKLFLASDNLEVEILDSEPVGPGEVCVEISGVFDDRSGNEIKGPPPGGTSVAFETSNGSFLEPSSFSTTTSYRETPVNVCAEVEADEEPSTGRITVTVTPPAPYDGAPFIERIDFVD